MILLLQLTVPAALIALVLLAAKPPRKGSESRR